MIRVLLTMNRAEGEKRVEANLEMKLYNCTLEEVKSDLLDDILGGRDSRGWVLEKIEEEEDGG